MAKIKNTMTVSLEEFGKKAGEYALDEFEYKGLTIRQWADKITSGEYQPVKHGRWIYDGDCMITSCCNTAYDINKFQNNNGTILVPTICPNCGRKMDGDESPKGE